MLNVLRRMLYFLRQRQMDTDLAEELEFHRAMKQAELSASGVAAGDVENASRRALGNATVAREDARAVWVWRWLDDLGRDLTYATRSLKKNPSFSAVAVLTLALGIGANTAIFSVVDAAILHPVPFSEPERIMALHGKSDTTGWSAVSYPNFLDWQRQTRTFEAIAAWRIDFLTLVGRNQAERLKGGRVSANYFSILRVRPLLGRTFQPGDDQLGAPPVVLLGEGLWTRRFARDPLVIGQNITLDGRPHTVVGVMPGYVGLGVIDRLFNDAFLPIGQYQDKLFLSRGVYATEALGRLKPGVTLMEARAEMDGIARALAANYPEVNTGQGIYVLPVTDDLVGPLRPTIWLLVGAVAFVLLIACANVANLTLARAMGRVQEFAVRVALGASRGRIVRQVLTEHLLLSVAGGTVGLVLASWGTRSALSVLPSALPDSVHVGMNARVLIFAIGVTCLASLLGGLISALKVTQPHPQGTLKQGGHDGAIHRHYAQRFFVVAEVALTLTLLIGSGLMTRSLVLLWKTSPGFDPRGVLTLMTGLSRDNASSPDKVRASLREVNDRVAAVPGVEATSVGIGALPFTAYTSVSFWRDGEPRPSRSDLRYTLLYVVGPDYFRAMGIPLLRGRSFARQDNARGARVAMIDEELARSIYPNEDPVGKRIRFSLFKQPVEVIGVVGHVKQWGLDADATAEIRSQLYMPTMQLPDNIAPLAANGVVVIVRTAAPMADLLGPIRNAISALDSGQAINDEHAMDQVIANSLASRRFSLTVMAIFAGVGLVLSVVGMFGVISYLVRQRTHEIGVRMALGAEARHIRWSVVSEGGQLAIIGIVLGLVASLGLTQLIAGFLFGVTPTDVFTFAAVSVLLLAVTLIACYIPARRATKVDPMVALRCE